MHDHELEALGPVAPARERSIVGRDDSAPTISRAVTDGRARDLDPAALQHLQRQVGNHAVTSLLGDPSRAGATVQRTEDEGEEVSPVRHVVASNGSPLDPAVRAPMERALGHDFGDVQVHTDAAAAASARSVQAHAYTVGNHVVFGDGRFRPETTEGQRTLAHELTHVVQQRSGPVDGTPAAGGIRVSDPGDRFEREAEQAGAHYVSGPPAANPPTEGPVQRDADLDVAPVQRQSSEEEEGADQAPPAEGPSEAVEEPKDEDEPVQALSAQRQQADEEADEESPTA